MCYSLHKAKFPAAPVLRAAPPTILREARALCTWGLRGRARPGLSAPALREPRPCPLRAWVLAGRGGAGRDLRRVPTPPWLCRQVLAVARWSARRRDGGPGLTGGVWLHPDGAGPADPGTPGQLQPGPALRGQAEAGGQQRPQRQGGPEPADPGAGAADPGPPG